MTEFLIVIIQFAAETAFPAAMSIPFDWPTYRRKSEVTNFVVLCFLFLVAGGSLGLFLSAFIPPVLHLPALKIANLFVSPLLAGFVGYKIAKWKSENTDPTIISGFHFWYTFLFAFSFVCMRLAYAK
jgi:hypothetical protein